MKFAENFQIGRWFSWFFVSAFLLV